MYIPTPEFEDHTHADDRYIGKDLGVSLEHLHGEAASTLRRLYSISHNLYEICQKARDQNSPEFLTNQLAQMNWSEIIIDAKHNLSPRRNGTVSEDQQRKIFHDIRGGAFSNLTLLIDLVEMLGDKCTLWHVERLYFLVRDHLKIMRNCLTDIDPEGRAEDLEHKYHSMDLIREKWDGYEVENKSVRCLGDKGINIASCCMEFSTLDRVIYNMVNNAIRHAQPHSEIHIETAQRGKTANHQHLLVVVRNRLSDDACQKLEQLCGGDYSKLFDQKTSSTGSGLGLAIAAQAVSSAYRLRSTEHAIVEHIIGAMLEENEFSIWVHWPVLAD